MSWGRVYLPECLVWAVRKTQLEISIRGGGCVLPRCAQPPALDGLRTACETGSCGDAGGRASA